MPSIPSHLTHQWGEKKREKWEGGGERYLLEYLRRIIHSLSIDGIILVLLDLDLLSTTFAILKGVSKREEKGEVFGLRECDVFDGDLLWVYQNEFSLDLY